jgi:hypothetical protein
MVAPAKKKKSGCGCGCATLVVFVVVPVVAFFVYAALVAPPAAAATAPTTTTTTTATTPPPWAAWRPNDDPFAVGWCAPNASTERTRGRYERTVGGTAPWMRKNVVVVHLRVEAPGARWSDAERARLDLAAAAATRFYEREARRYNVTDLRIRTVTWPLLASVPIPDISPGARNVMSSSAALALETAVKAGLRSAEARTLDGIAEGYKKQGYDAVAFIAYVPTDTSARSYAEPHGRDDNAEMAFVFETKTLIGMSSAAAHEGLHLFGADDLYQLTPADDGDAHDIMSVCRGFQGNEIGEATAWSIGWRPRPPARRYRF